ncbi:hypothetical protein FHU10_2932 [Serratia fonticola]|uniref:Uncharacterized protein n=1 Tax=Serratia fonticola TaxID=47917 RepID=A0A559T6Y6_SERFO|nr:hypothetical protein FHU09_4778 [Serratia fonticola]TQI95867.1 hypothetical protein FHU11_1270 [Serratia fonticola]TVZ70364.1 hypothetical protein FHU10_2932 [Serratia fonticola]
MSESMRVIQAVDYERVVLESRVRDRDRDFIDHCISGRSIAGGGI